MLASELSALQQLTLVCIYDDFFSGCTVMHEPAIRVLSSELPAVQQLILVCTCDVASRDALGCTNDPGALQYTGQAVAARIVVHS